MREIITTRTVVMTCDICGKHEEIAEGQKLMPGVSFWMRNWTEVGFLEGICGTDEIKRYHLCPKCTRKFKKLVAAVEIDEESEG